MKGKLRKLSYKPESKENIVADYDRIETLLKSMRENPEEYDPEIIAGTMIQSDIIHKKIFRWNEENTNNQITL